MSLPLKANTRLSLVLWAAALLGILSVLPYQFALLGPQLQAAAKLHNMSVIQLLLMGMAQSAVLLGAAAFVGSWASSRVGLRAPLLSAWVSALPFPRGLGPVFVQAIWVGGLCAVFVLGLDLLFVRASPEILALQQSPATAGLIWQGLLASLYGGIVEEILLRWCVLSLIALGLRALLRKLFGRPTTDLPTTVFWAANLISAALFGLGHLPATAQLLPLTAVIVTRALLLNGIVGVAAGWMFRRAGLESAMLLHFSADIGLHVLGPMLAAAPSVF